VLTTGGTGPALRDVTPEATLAVADKEMPGFGEQMRQISLKFVPTAILSRQVAVIRFRRDAQPAAGALPGHVQRRARTAP
jgi:molybdopterin adenylyltransferase